MNNRTAVALLWLNYGPYHMVRARALAQRQELECHFIELTGSDNTHPWDRADTSDGLNLLTLSGSRLSVRQSSRRLIKELSRLDPDVVVTCNYSLKEMRVASRWAKRRGRGSIMMTDSTLIDLPRYRLKELAKRWMIRTHFDAALVSGLRSREYLIRLGMPRSKLWEGYNLVDNDYFERSASAVRREAASHRIRLGTPERYFLFVGRLAPEKNLPRLLKAYAIYRGESPEGFGLVIVGDGPLKEELRLLTSQLGLTDVRWVGFQQLDEIAAYYALAECLVLPSISETWGLVVNEAMACSLPVLVSSYCGCVPELVRCDENGFVFDPYDVREIASWLKTVYLLSEQQRRWMGTNSSAIVSKYTPESWATNLADCIRATVGERTNRAPARGRKFYHYHLVHSPRIKRARVPQDSEGPAKTSRG